MSRLAIPERDGFQFPIDADVEAFWSATMGGMWMGASVPDRIYWLPGMRLDEGEYYYAVKFTDRKEREIYSREVIELAMGGRPPVAAIARRMERAG